MRFYPASRFSLGLKTAMLAASIVVGADVALHGRPWGGVGLLLLGAVNLNSLWRRYWEIRPDGTLFWSGWGTSGTLRASDLRYAGPVRDDPGFPVSRRKDLELEWVGVHRRRFVRVADRAGFLAQLRSASPEAEVVCWTGSHDDAKATS